MTDKKADTPSKAKAEKAEATAQPEVSVADRVRAWRDRVDWHLI